MKKLEGDVAKRIGADRMNHEEMHPMSIRFYVNNLVWKLLLVWSYHIWL
jgi:hypothetical protein